MTTKIYSKIDPSKLLHMIVRSVPEGRTNLCEDKEFLQCAALKLPKGTTFRPHKHNWNKVDEFRVAQESWHIEKGEVEITMYDLDDTIICKDIMKEGDTSFSFRGGHTYKILSDDSFILEYKTGSYKGVEHDKTFIV